MINLAKLPLWNCQWLAAALISVTSFAPATALAGEEFFSVRNYSPFAQVYGLPGFADATVLDQRQYSLALSTTVINHADQGSAPGETIFLDGETYITDLTLGVGVTDRLTLGVTVPWVAYNGGVFDSAIETWHDIWGFPNGFRDGADDELFIRYESNGVEEFLLDTSSSGIGDVRLEAAYQLTQSEAADFGVVLRVGAKLPTGDSADLSGSEATDFSLDLAVRKELALRNSKLILLAHAGALFLGDGEVLPELQRDTVGFAGAGAVWRASERWRFNLQFYGQTSYFDSDVKELGSEGISITAGLSYSWLESRTQLSVSMVEDLVTDIIPDVALQIKLTKDFR
ncbi:MAG: DUF3187 family protein [Pseudomonadales bacterium]